MSRRYVRVAALTLLAATGANATDGGTDGAKAYSHGLVELKRQNTGRGTPGETTKGNLKFDFFPRGDVVSLLRLELAFPDEKTTFWGGNPQFGDDKIRMGIHAIDVSGRPVTSFVELAP